MAAVTYGFAGNLLDLQRQGPTPATNWCSLAAQYEWAMEGFCGGGVGLYMEGLGSENRFQNRANSSREDSARIR